MNIGLGLGLRSLLLERAEPADFALEHVDIAFDEFESVLTLAAVRLRRLPTELGGDGGPERLPPTHKVLFEIAVVVAHAELEDAFGAEFLETLVEVDADLIVVLVRLVAKAEYLNKRNTRSSCMPFPSPIRRPLLSLLSLRVPHSGASVFY